ncbi:hypothetical protein [Klebsiella quasipneumoniae]|uniref:hypothetical protein n=1 Tax=Klebsiella quasipneumoniae TaxID=1463165 RepID=UPI0029DE641F|nr:hypothetical protein [Klebsiella quasipneumoniae]
MTDITELALMKGQKVEAPYYLAECTECGKMYSSSKLIESRNYFDGDADCYCPHCNAEDADIADLGSGEQPAAMAWNYQQARIDTLVEALEKSEKTSEARREAIDRAHNMFVRERDRANAAEEALEKAPQAPIMPLGLHPDTQKLVTDFCTALAEKLYKAQLKYGYDTDWKQDWWPSQCQAHFHQHIAKGDPRDVAAYCAFMWWHGWSTKPAEGLESRTVTVKLPDYRDTYKSPLADEVEHQVRLALELLSSAAGIKVEAE